MRTVIFSIALFLSASLSLSAGETMRLNFVKGIYSVNVPVNWYVDIDAGDATLSIAQGPEPTAPRVVVAVPNAQMADRPDEYARMAADAFMQSLGGGQIVEDKAEGDEHGVIFRSAVAGLGFLGAVHVQRHDGHAILTVFLTRESDYPRSKDWAALILNSLRINDQNLEGQAAFVDRQADNLLRDFRQNRGMASSRQRAEPDETGLDWLSPNDGGTDGGLGGELGGLINNPFSGLTR